MENKPEREQRLREATLARMTEAIASIERTRKILDERLARAGAKRAS